MKLESTRRSTTSPAIAQFPHVEGRMIDNKLPRIFVQPRRQPRFELISKEPFEGFMACFRSSLGRQMEMKLPRVHFDSRPRSFLRVNPQKILPPKEADSIPGAKDFGVDRRMTSGEIQLLQDPRSFPLNMRPDGRRPHSQRRSHLDPRTTDGDADRVSIPRTPDAVGDVRAAEADRVTLECSGHDQRFRWTRASSIKEATSSSMASPGIE